MSDEAPSPAQSTKGVMADAIEPGFWRAWQGIWSLTWRAQFTWRRLPLLLLTLLVIPLLTYFTLGPLTQLSARDDWREKPSKQMNEFKARVASANVPLARGLGARITDIIGEEQSRVEPLLPLKDPTNAARFSQEALDRQMDQARACQERIRQRVQALLNARQLALFEQFQEAKLAEASAIIQRLNLQDLRPFYHWLINFYFRLALPLYCLSVCGSMIRDELQADTLVFLTTRPVGRGPLFLIQYLCHVLRLETVVAIHGALLFCAGAIRGVPGLGSVVVIFFAAQALAVLAWGALSALLGLITRRYLVLGMVYGFVVEFGIGHIPTNINTLSLTRHLQALLGHNPLVNQLYDWAPQSVGYSVGWLILATVLFLGAGAFLFTFREYHHVTEMQK
jgi:hypothetical protein